MTGNPRKTARKAAPRKAAPRKAPARPQVVEPERFDILAELGTDPKEPVPITLMGIDADVRRGFTGAEAVEFYELVDGMRFDEMLTLLCGEAGPALWEKVTHLTPAHASAVLNKIIGYSELHQGELLAPLPTFEAGMAGVPPTQDSDGSTS